MAIEVQGTSSAATWYCDPPTDGTFENDQSGAQEDKQSADGDHSRVVELSADARHAEAPGKLKKSRSGLFKGLGFRKKSSGSLPDEAPRTPNDTTDSRPPSENGAADDCAHDKAEKKKGGFFGLGRRKKSSSSLSEHADHHAADNQHVEDATATYSEEYAPEQLEEQQPEKKRVGGLLGKMKHAKSLSKRGLHDAEEDAGEPEGAAVEQESDLTHDQGGSPQGHQEDSGMCGSSDCISAHHYSEIAPSEFTNEAGLVDEQQPDHQQHQGVEEELEYAPAEHEHSEIRAETEEEQQPKNGFYGFIGRARSGNLSAIFGKPKDEAQLQAEKFPRGFMWGTATSAYQIEGAYQDEGKGLSIWDAFTHTPGKISGNANADISCCHFYRFKEDVALMRAMGVKYYRMSFAWSRLFPNGKGKVNERGVAFYNRLINELIANRIMPVVTLYHWDLPLSLQIEEDGWLNPKIVDHFVKYAKLCFSRFGDRVKFWITVNEPWCAAVLGHDSGGQHAPGRTVDPAREVYKVAHHMLIAHGRTYQMYQRLFKRKQRGKIGLALNGDWYEAKPAAILEEQRRNEKAAERALEFSLGWFARPVYQADRPFSWAMDNELLALGHQGCIRGKSQTSLTVKPVGASGQGDYPSLMRERCGNRLPRFTAEQRAMLQGSCDFFGLNHYSSHLCEQPSWHKELSPVEDDGERENKLQKLGAQLERIIGNVTGARTNEAEIQEGDLPAEPEPKVQVVEDDDEIPEDPYIESTGYWQDISVDQSDDDVWKTTDMGWGVYPQGMRKMLNYIQREYNPKGGIIITENGCAVAEEDVDEAVKDIERAVYLKRYLTEVHKALLHDDVDVRGYFVWSLLDNFEWGYGYQKKFGLHYVDLQTLERIPKMSANWYAEVIKKNRLDMM
eukprot:gene2379-2684_t